MILVIVLAGIFLFLLSVAFVILILGPLILLQPHRRSRDWYARITSVLQPGDLGLPQEDLWLTTPDGVNLSCWLVANKKPRGTIIYLHGVGDCKIGGVAPASFFFSQGYNVFLYDSRHHGESGGKYCTYGFYERHDVSTVVDYLQQREDIRCGKVGLFGTSMGAAVAIQAAAIDGRIAAVVAEASFTTLRSIAVDYQKRLIKLPWHFLRNVALARSQRVAGFKARNVSPLDDVKKLQCPILFVHGLADTFIDVQYSWDLYNETPGPKQIHLVEGAVHNNVWETGGKQYQDVLAAFFGNALH
ncbi:MAG TPA: alpha/beta fold hydrolase [Bacteroidota bacterium]|nr:alpha/beta fold hydrolase [Bacteroidota bacterium]